MPVRDPTRESSEFYCYSLRQRTRKDTTDIKGFTPMHQAGAGVVEYLQEQAFKDERKGLMRTYLVRLKQTDELVGFFSLKAGLVSTKEKSDGDRALFDTIPGVEIAYLAIDKRFVDKYPAAKGCGLVVFSELIIPIIQEAAECVGIARVYIFALDESRLIETYHGYGFRSLTEEQERDLHRRLKPRGMRDCRFMYMRL